MSSRRLSFTEKRRAKLARSVAQLDRAGDSQHDHRADFGVGPQLICVSRARSDRPDGPERRPQWPERTRAAGRGGSVEAFARQARRPTNFIPIEIAAPIDQPATAGGGVRADGSAPAAEAKVPAGDGPAAVAPAAAPASTQSGISAPWHPAKGPGGGAALPPRGGSGAGPAHREAREPARGRRTEPSRIHAGRQQLRSLGSASGRRGRRGGGNGPRLRPEGARPRSAGAPRPPASSSQPAPAGSTRRGASKPSSLDDSISGSGGGTSRAPRLDARPHRQQRLRGQASYTFPYFPIYVLDVDNGVVLYPGVTQQATLNGSRHPPGPGFRYDRVLLQLGHLGAHHGRHRASRAPAPTSSASFGPYRYYVKHHMSIRLR